MALSTMKLIAFGQVPFTIYRYLMVPTRSKWNMPAERLIYKPQDAKRYLTEILYPLYIWVLIGYQGKNPFLPPHDTGSIYEAFSKQKWVNNSSKSQNMFRLLCWRWLQGKTLPSRFGLFAQCRGGEVSKEQVSFETGRCKLSFGQFEESFVSMCNDVLRLRAQLGGDWVVTFGLPTRSTLI